LGACALGYKSPFSCTLSKSLLTWEDVDRQTHSIFGTIGNKTRADTRGVSTILIKYRYLYNIASTFAALTGSLMIDVPEYTYYIVYIVFSYSNNDDDNDNIVWSIQKIDWQINA